MNQDEIDDHSKSDLFTKIITVVQVFSVIVQVIVRWRRNLTISQLELAVTAFSVSAAVTYCFVLYKPKGIQTITILRNDGKHLTFDKAYYICVGERLEPWIRSKKGKSYYLNGGVDNGNPHNTTKYNNKSFTIGATLGGTIFGAVHCCGWFFSFPTNLELLLWRIACILTTSFPIIIFCSGLLLGTITDNRYDMPLFLAVLVIVLFYVIARVFIMVEVFRTLFYLPPNAFISTWANNIPQFS